MKCFNRELSLIASNWRILQKSESNRVPLLKRPRFIAISAPNPYKLYSIRVMVYKQTAKTKWLYHVKDWRLLKRDINRINIYPVWPSINIFNRVSSIISIVIPKLGLNPPNSCFFPINALLKVYFVPSEAIVWLKP